MENSKANEAAAEPPLDCRVGLLPCPFCGEPLAARWTGANPRAKCVTDDCMGARLPVVNLDVLEDVAAWNTRNGVTNAI